MTAPAQSPAKSKVTPLCDVGGDHPAVGMVTCDTRLSVGGGSFRGFRCQCHADSVMASFRDMGFTAKLERFREPSE